MKLNFPYQSQLSKILNNVDVLCQLSCRQVHDFKDDTDDDEKSQSDETIIQHIAANRDTTYILRNRRIYEVMNYLRMLEILISVGRIVASKSDMEH